MKRFVLLGLTGVVTVLAFQNCGQGFSAIQPSQEKACPAGMMDCGFQGPELSSLKLSYNNGFSTEIKNYQVVFHFMGDQAGTISVTMSYRNDSLAVAQSCVFEEHLTDEQLAEVKLKLGAAKRQVAHNEHIIADGATRTAVISRKFKSSSEGLPVIPDETVHYMNYMTSMDQVYFEPASRDALYNVAYEVTHSLSNISLCPTDWNILFADH